jgi:UDP-N-acetylglucosamine--N-acetylmuramyl-(pentapeptide) pyrophosphoryl-undecaprenol N-acetylglucosamine transferase
VQQQRLSIVFAGGGTGGHLFPAIAIAEEIRKHEPTAEITFVGTRHKIEARVVPQHGFRFETIWVSGFRRKFTPENILFPVKFVVSIAQSFFLMWRVRPDVVVGTGGYVCGPPLFAALVMGIPTLIQEQNSYPGVTTRLLASRASEVHLSFKSSQRHLKRLDNVRMSGNPTRAGIAKISRPAGAVHFGISPSKPTLLVFGGSLGASSINNAVQKLLPQLIANGIQLIWQTGEIDYDRIRAETNRMIEISRGVIMVHRFIERMEHAYAACDLAVCRAGATTVAELAKAGVASILVPYPYAAADHQTENAKAMLESGAAVIIRDAELGEKLLTTIEILLANPTQLQLMRAKALEVGNPEATGVLARAVVNLAKAKHGRA